MVFGGMLSRRPRVEVMNAWSASVVTERPRAGREKEKGSRAHIIGVLLKESSLALLGAGELASNC